MNTGLIKVLITGGFGYIGGSISKALSKRGYEVHLLDNGETSEVSQERCDFLGASSYTRGTILNQHTIENILDWFAPDELIHCAGLKSVSEGETNSAAYWETNVGGTYTLCRAWADRGRMVFSSSASVYGNVDSWEGKPVFETARVNPVSVYGKTKSNAEILMGNNAVILRYFNPAGVYEGITSTDMNSGNLFDVLRTTESRLRINGGDWPTKDGTCVRDYIHIEDLVNAHIWALEKPWTGSKEVYNVGTGKGTSVKEIMEAMDRSYDIVGRRAGDVASLVASVQKITSEGFTCKKTIEDIIASELESRNK